MKSKKINNVRGKGMKIRRVRPGSLPANRLIQKSIDAADGGGVVEIPAGVYSLDNALELRSGVRLIGESGTILRKIPSVSSPLTQMVGFGHREFLVKDPGKFKVGMGVCLSDAKAFGFYETVGSIVERKGDYFYVDEPFHHDYLPSHGAFARSVFPLIRGCGVRGAAIANLTLEAPGERYPINGCLGGAVILLQSHEIELHNLEVRRYHGEGISFQQCTDVLIRGCFIHHNRGNGIHPGSGSVRYRILENSIQHNLRCGIFYCFRSTHSLCQRNEIQHNGQAGISIGERDTHHQVCDNRLRCNGGPGVEFREKLRQSGEHVILENNEFAANCTAFGEGEISLADGIKDVRISGNQFLASPKKPLYLDKGCRRIDFFDNAVGDCMQNRMDVAGSARTVSFSPKGAFAPVGPAAAGREAARHLGIALPPLPTGGGG